MSGNSKDQAARAASDGANQLAASGPVLARWLGISGKAVYELAKAGILVRVSRDQFSLEDSVHRYCAYIRQSASQHNGNARRDQGVNGADHQPAS